MQENNVVICLPVKKILKYINSTFIMLIPKNKWSKLITHMQPISLITSIYKIMAKFLADGLRKVLVDLISENQNTFIPQKLMMDSVMSVNE